MGVVSRRLSSAESTCITANMIYDGIMELFCKNQSICVQSRRSESIVLIPFCPRQIDEVLCERAAKRGDV